MAQVDSDTFLPLGYRDPIYGQSDGLYYRRSNGNLCLVINGTVVQEWTAADSAPSQIVGSEAQGDILRYSGTVWERHAAATSGQILVGDGTDIVSVAVSGDVTLDGAGAVTIAAGAVTNSMLAGSITRANLLQEDAAVYAVPLEHMRVHDALASALPTTASADDMGFIPGTFGTDAPTLQGVDFGGTATDEKCRFQYRLPVEYVDGQTITLRCHAGMLTTVSDGTATLDAEVYLDDGEGAVGSDICATAAQSINSLTLADIDFTVTPAGVVSGSLLDIRLSFAGSDTGDLGVMIPTITAVSMLLDVKG